MMADEEGLMAIFDTRMVQHHRNCEQEHSNSDGWEGISPSPPLGYALVCCHYNKIIVRFRIPWMYQEGTKLHVKVCLPV